MSTQIVNLGEFVVSKKSDDILKSSPLGASLGIAFVVRSKSIAGLLHVGLVDSNFEKSTEMEIIPGMYADTGVRAILKEMMNAGWEDLNEMEVKIAGGAGILNNDDLFDLGSNLVTGVEEILKKFKLIPHNKEVGGRTNISISVDVGSGEVMVDYPSGESWQL